MYVGGTAALTHLGSPQIAESDVFSTHLERFPPLVHTRRRVVSASSALGGAAAAAAASAGAGAGAGAGTGAGGAAATTFEFERLPYFSGDFVQTEIELILSQLESVTSDLVETSVREWWNAVFGPRPAVEVVSHPKRRDEELVAGEPYTVTGLPRPRYTFLVKPSVGDLAHDELVALEKTTCTVEERDLWMMRRVAAAVKPLKENFMTLQFRGEPGDWTGAASASASAAASGGKQQPRKRARSASSSSGSSPGHAGGGGGGASSSSGAGASGDVEYTRLGSVMLASDMSDPDSTLPETLFDNRLALLDLMQHLHLQFDQYRRAKHSSLVILKCLAASLCGSKAGAPRHGVVASPRASGAGASASFS